MWKNRVQHRNKRYNPYKITCFDTASRTKSTAETNNPALYNETADLDLIAKEFKVHEHCYKTFTLTPVENANVASDANSNEVVFAITMKLYLLLEIKLWRSQGICRVTDIS